MKSANWGMVPKRIGQSLLKHLLLAQEGLLSQSLRETAIPVQFWMMEMSAAGDTMM